jgi:hypothetical protein
MTEGLTKYPSYFYHRTDFSQRKTSTEDFTEPSNENKKNVKRSKLQFDNIGTAKSFAII